MPTIEHAGATIWCMEEGRGESVLLVHGGLFDRMDGERFWQVPRIVDDLLTAGYGILVPDSRFCGRTSAPYTIHSWQIEARDLFAVLRAASVTRAHVVAGSNGCSAAVRLALAAPRLVRSLVLCWPTTPDNDLLLDAFTRSAAAIETMGPAAYLETLRADGVPHLDEERPGYPFGFALLRDPHAAARFLEQSAAGAATIMRATAEALLPGSPIRGITAAESQVLGGLGMPITVIPAEPDDLGHTLTVAAALANAVPGAQLAQGFPLSTSSRFAAALTAFSATLQQLLTAAGAAG